jgi:hypothetical protein
VTEKLLVGVKVITTLSIVLSLTVAGLGFVVPSDVKRAISSTLSTIGILATPRTLQALDPSRDVSQSQGELGSCLVFAVAMVRGPPHAA